MANITRYDPFGDLDDFFKGFFVRPVAFEGEKPMQIKLDVKENERVSSDLAAAGDAAVDAAGDAAAAAGDAAAAAGDAAAAAGDAVAGAATDAVQATGEAVESAGEAIQEAAK